MNIPITKATQLVASLELGKRFFKKKNGTASIIRTPEDAYEYLKDMSLLSKECMRGIYLNSHHQVIHDEVISIGTVDASIVHPRDIFRPAFEYSAVAVILAHNHPSGNLEPSATDIEITDQINKAGDIMGVTLLDHIVVSSEGFKSILSYIK